MQRLKTVIHVYSDLNPQVDLVVMLENEEYLECAEFIINQAYDEWFEGENGSHDMPIGDYISKKLLEDDPDLEFEIYVC